jgi:hypothetical protein
VSCTTENPLDALLARILRAGLRTPTPAGLLSALRAAHGLVERYAPVDQADRDDEQANHVVIPVGDGERWCRHCGEVAMPSMGFGNRDDGEASPCCRRPQPVPVVAILQPEEYYTR